MMPNMMPNMFPNNQNFNNFNNNFNNFNNNPFLMNTCVNMNNMCFIPNQNMNMNMNMNMPGMNMDVVQCWQGIYNTQMINPNQNMQQMINNGGIDTSNKVNIFLTTTRGIRVNMKIDCGKRVCDLIRQYFLLINREDLLQNPQDLCFIYNAVKMNFNDQTPVEQFFRSGFARITINDIRGLIGAY